MQPIDSHKPVKMQSELINLKNIVMTKQSLNIAERIINGYDSKDFKENYFFVLAETFVNNKAEIINRIIDKFNVSNYETEKYLSNWRVINREEANKIYEFINENLKEFTDTFKSYWVGYTSLESIAFGEQEQQISGLYNHKTGKCYSLKYTQKAFNDAGYYVNGDLAYYNLGGGLHVDLLHNAEKLNQFLGSLNTEENS